MMKAYLLRLPEDKHRQFKILASSLGKTMSELVVSWITREAEKKMTIADYLNMPISDDEEISEETKKAIKAAAKDLDENGGQEFHAFLKKKGWKS